MLEPGRPNCLYHSESLQEAFLVLSGKCRLLVNGEERLLGPWDFFHCPAGRGARVRRRGRRAVRRPLVGARTEDEQLLYPVSELAATYGASAEVETPDPGVAYARSRGQSPDVLRPGISFPGPRPLAFHSEGDTIARPNREAECPSTTCCNLRTGRGGPGGVDRPDPREDQPPDGVPARRITMLADRAAGKVVVAMRFGSERDLRAASAVLDGMEPPAAGSRRRVSVEAYEVVLEREY